MNGAQWEILRSLASDAVMCMAHNRLLHGLKFFDGTKLMDAYTRADVKLALLIVRIANPTEEFTDKETALMNAPARAGQEKVKVFKGTNRANKGKQGHESNS